MTGLMQFPSQSQLPNGEAIFLDHVGHFVADPEAAAAALARAGFAPTPISVQVTPDPDGGPPKPTGTGNVCAMLRAGYLEVLFKTADTPLGEQLDAGRARYDGLHLVAFAVDDAEAGHARLQAAGFPMQPLVRMQRPVEIASATVSPTTGIAAFEVVRVEPGAMPEGRVQILRHRTEETVWQPRWLDHANGATGLRALTIVVGDVDEAAHRFARFLGRPAQSIEGGCRIQLDRGELRLLTGDAWSSRWPGVAIPAHPFMGETMIEVADLRKTDEVLRAGGLTLLTGTDGLSVRLPAALGHGVWTFVEK